ncbi:MAG: carbohydrate ABC transporter permease [Firmicutes bacterium]|nr:carbohydrate ABC transporter permease [Bacillota bacterium]
MEVNFLKIKVGSIIFYSVMTVLSITMIYPFIWGVTASFKTTAQLYNGNPFNLIPNPITTYNYERVVELLPFGRFVLNSLFLSTFVPVLQIILASMAAYSFARLNFKGKNIIFLMLLGTMMIPGHVTLIPNFIIMRILHWIDKYEALIVPSLVSGGNIFNIFFLRQYFLSIPKDLEAAAIIDGCSRFRVFLNIILPNAKPALATVAILSFNRKWNEFLWPMIVMNTYEKMPIQVGLQYLKGSVNTNWGIVLAGSTIAILPTIIIFLVFQKYFIRTVVNTGLGGQ